jgi:hypothetical protein
MVACESFYGSEFPGPENIVYGYLQNGEFTFKGFPSSAQHVINCSSCHSIETGSSVASELIGHQRSLSDGGREEASGSVYSQPTESECLETVVPTIVPAQLACVTEKPASQTRKILGSSVTLTTM